MTMRLTRVKLGALAAATVMAAVAIVLGLGLRRGPTVAYHVYFDESVQGLDIGAPVKYRGVDVGRVAGIAVAPDRRHVDVEVAVERDLAHHLALDDAGDRLRARLALQGVTGLKFIDIDLLDPTAPVLSPLTFEPAPRHIRARLSMLEDLGADLAQVGDRLPVLIDRGISTLTKLERLLDAAEREALPAHATEVLVSANRTLVDVRRLVASVDRAAVPDRMRDTLARVDRMLAGVDTVVGDLGRNSEDSSIELQRALRELGETARSLHDLIDEIDRDPDMLVKGRAKSRRP